MSIVVGEVYTRFEDVPPGPTSVTIGAFDGVHRGHQHLLAQARQSADASDARVVAITFSPLPIQLFRPEGFPGRIVTDARRRDLLHAFGADVVLELPFTQEFSQWTAEAFMDAVRRFGHINDLWVGEDFALGRKRTGTPQRLAEITAGYGTKVHAVSRVGVDGCDVSSSAVRKLILEGDAAEAARLLGHRFQVSGEVVLGNQLGRKIGFPTANVGPPADIVPMRDGIYASVAFVGNERHGRPAMTYIGTRPAVNTGTRMIETHLFDFDGDLYGKVLTTQFVARLRADSDFASVEALQAQLAEDERMARRVLSQLQQHAAELR